MYRPNAQTTARPHSLLLLALQITPSQHHNFGVQLQTIFVFSTAQNCELNAQGNLWCGIREF